MLDIFWNEIVKEAEKGSIAIEDWTYNIHFYTNETVSKTENVPVLMVKNKEKFNQLLEQYILAVFQNEPVSKEEIKRHLALVWVNATASDFMDPNEFLKKQIAFLNNKVFETKTINMNELMNGMDLQIDISYYKADKDNPFSYETPYSFNTYFTDRENKYYLPSICYGISDDTCYIYSVQNKEDNREQPFTKKVKRMLYKANKDVYSNENDEYKAYTNLENDYYPENISDVSPSAIVALTVFLKELEKENINKIKVIPYLPIRYNNRVQSTKKRVDYLVEKQIMRADEKETMLSFYIEKINSTQNNITNKLLRNFFRLIFHFSNMEVTSYPMVDDETLNINLNPFITCNNPFLQIIINSLEEKNYRKE